MKGFIEVTEMESGMTVLLSVDKITAVLTDKDGAVFIETGFDKDGNSTGVVVSEKYDEVKSKFLLAR